MMTKNLTVALAGNPNCGKTTIFNNITGARQHVGNYPGVTVERREGFRRFQGEDLMIITLRATNSSKEWAVKLYVPGKSITSVAIFSPDTLTNVAAPVRLWKCGMERRASAGTNQSATRKILATHASPSST